MEYLDETIFDPEEKPVENVTLLGSFPGHIVDMREGNVVNGAIPYNYTVRIAPEAKDMKGVNYRSRERYLREIEKTNEEDKGPEEFLETVGENNMVGKELGTTGVWLTPKPEQGQSWRNRRFVEFHEALGVVFKEKKGKKVLGKPENEDVLGLPGIFTIELEAEKRKNDQGVKYKTGRYFPRVTNVSPWEDGDLLDIAEIVGDALPTDEDKQAEEDLKQSGF